MTQNVILTTSKGQNTFNTGSSIAFYGKKISKWRSTSTYQEAKPCSETAKNVNGKEPLETTTPLLTQSTVWQDMSRPLYSGCEQVTVACEHTWSEPASWTLHSAVARKRNRWSITSSRTVPSGRNRDTSYARRMSQPPTSCGERWKTCAAPSNSWQHVNWGSKHGWSTAKEEEEVEHNDTRTLVHAGWLPHLTSAANSGLFLNHWSQCKRLKKEKDWQPQIVSNCNHRLTIIYELEFCEDTGA